MAVPKKKTSKMKNAMRQAGKGLKKIRSFCLDSDGNPSLPHMASLAGIYKGVKVLVKVKKEKKEQSEGN